MPIASASRADLAWAAGLFEGEGCFTSSKTGNAQAVIGSTDLDVLEKFKDVIGFGAIKTKKKSALGKKDIWHWHATNHQHVQALVAAMWPWLCSRRKQRASEVLRAAAKTGRNRKYTGLRYFKFCRAGKHPTTPENLIEKVGGWVQCYPCMREKHRAYYLANKDKWRKRKNAAN